VYVERLFGNALGSSSDDFVIVQWKAAVGDHWIAPLHVHHRDDEAWYVLSGTLEFRLGDDQIEAPPGAAVLARRGSLTRRSRWWPAPMPGDLRTLSRCGL